MGGGPSGLPSIPFFVEDTPLLGRPPSLGPHFAESFPPGQGWLVPTLWPDPGLTAEGCCPCLPERPPGNTSRGYNQQSPRSAPHHSMLEPHQQLPWHCISQPGAFDLSSAQSLSDQPCRPRPFTLSLFFSLSLPRSQPAPLIYPISLLHLPLFLPLLHHILRITPLFHFSFQMR